MPTLSNERITTCISPEMKILLEKALSLSGYTSLNGFIVQAVIAEAKRLIEQDMRIKLCQKDALDSINALEKPIEINNRFLRAARKHKEKILDENKFSE